MLRLFAALPVPADVTQQLTPLQNNLSGASWRPIENFHITLRFFGDVSRDLAYELDREIAEIPAGPFSSVCVAADISANASRELFGRA